ncbi:MAG: PAS domain-containing protein, partial [Bradyrhizobium sp.]|nr:PAS domain-containing protein [Bradyrhizobium sp.]
EVKGKHDSMFVEPAERASAAYREFWAKLNRGEPQSAEYKRIGKNGQEVWIHALYSPILGLNGRPSKVVTYVKEMSASIREIYETMIKPEETVHAAAIGQGFAGKLEHSANQANQGNEAGSLSLSMRRLEARRKAAAGRSKFSQFLENLRDGLSNTMMSSSRAVVNFL